MIFKLIGGRKATYYSNGNYEAFDRSRKPNDAEKKSVYLVGSRLVSLAASVFLIRDGRMKGNKIRVFDELPYHNVNSTGNRMYYIRK